MQLINRLKEWYDRVIVLGHSMGSGIAFHAVLEDAPLTGMIVTSVNGVPSKKVRFFLVLSKYLHIRSFKTIFWNLRAAHFEPDYIRWKIKHFPRLWFNVFADAIESLPGYISKLHEITIPIMVMHGARDFATNVDKTAALYFNAVQSREKITVKVKKTGHDLFLSKKCPAIMQEVKAFIQTILDGTGELIARRKIIP